MYHEEIRRATIRRENTSLILSLKRWKRARPSKIQQGPEVIPCAFFVIARTSTDQSVTRITSHRDLLGAIHTARSVLLLKPDAVRVEVHHREGLTSNYDGTTTAKEIDK